MRLFRNILSLLLAGLLFLVPLLMPIMLFSLFSSNPDRAIFGYSLETIVGEEFIHPPYKGGDVFILRHCSPEDVRVGNLIMVKIDAPISKADGRTHKVVSIETEHWGETGLWFVTRVNNKTWDEFPIPAERFIGKVTGTVPVLGWMFRNPLATLIVCWSIAIFILLRLAFQERRRQRRLAAKSPRLPPVEEAVSLAD